MADSFGLNWIMCPTASLRVYGVVNCELEDEVFVCESGVSGSALDCMFLRSI